ncbi:MAG TPA: hypothetical protein VHV30_00490 [Polyangiaceae bacterium]|jgi:hypothetical protein|nr:hypothetical protein [Polyangiaceae bacterium]
MRRGNRRHSALAVALFALAGVGGAVAACSSGESNAPLGNGDTLHVDVDASTLPPQGDADPDPDVFAPVDGSSIFGKGDYDAASLAVLAICLPPDASASAGDGGRRGKDASAASGAEDAGVMAEDGGAGADAGCVPFPSTCDPGEQPSPCTCLLGAFTDVPCTYPSCAVNLAMNGYTLYCPPGGSYGTVSYADSGTTVAVDGGAGSGDN